MEVSEEVVGAGFGLRSERNLTVRLPFPKVGTAQNP